MGEPILSVKHALETGQQCSFATSPPRKRGEIGRPEKGTNKHTKGKQVNIPAPR